MTIFLTNEALAERLMALERLVHDKFTNSENALNVARGAMEARLEGMNEFRASLSDLANNAVPRKEYQVTVGRLDADIKLLMKSRAEMEGKASQQALVIVAAITMFIAIPMAYADPKVDHALKGQYAFSGPGQCVISTTGFGENMSPIRGLLCLRLPRFGRESTHSTETVRILLRPSTAASNSLL